MAAPRRTAGARSQARTRPRSTAPRLMRRVIWRRTSSRQIWPTAARSSSAMPSAWRSRCRSTWTCTEPERSTKRTLRTPSAKSWICRRPASAGTSTLTGRSMPRPPPTAISDARPAVTDPSPGKKRTWSRRSGRPSPAERRAVIADGGRRRSTEAFFGRRRGKRVRPLQAAALQAGLDRYRLDIGLPPPGRLEDLFEAAVSEVRLEIGFGGGEHLVNEAVRHRWTGFLGVEPFVNSMAKMMAALADLPLPNLRVYDDDATRLLDWLPAASLSGIDLLYPDPWPKKKHWKRRFVNPANLQRFGRVLKRGGSLRFASDIPS